MAKNMIMTPLLVASLPCEDISYSTDGRLNVHRILSDVFADVFPARFGQLIIVNIWQGGNLKITDTTRIIAPDGTPLSEGKSTFQAKERSRHVQVYLFPDFVFPTQGEYLVEVKRDAVTTLSYAIEAKEEKIKKEEKKGVA